MTILQLPATLESLTALNEFIDHVVPESFKSQIDNVKLVAEELLVNVFSYAYPNKNGNAEVGIHTVVADNEELLCLSVKDWGPSFNPFEQVKTPDISLSLEDRPIGGLGVFLIRQLTCEQRYTYEEKANCIQVFFRKISADAPAQE